MSCLSGLVWRNYKVKSESLYGTCKTKCFGCYAYGHFRHTCRYTRKCMVCGKDYHEECNAEPSCINCGGNHRAMDKKRCVLYEYNLNLKKAMADRNISIYEARKIVKRPDLRRDIEWRKELTLTEEENGRMRNLYEKRRRPRQETQYEYRD